MPNHLFHPGKTVSQYLDRYAEPEAALATQCLPASVCYEFSIGIPARDETPGFVHELAESVSRATLLVLVVNQPGSGPASNANRRLVSEIRASSECLAGHEHLSLLRLNERCDVLLVNRCEPGLQIARQKGVGLARKIAADCQLALHTRGSIMSPWLCCSDADAKLPQDYFSVVASLPLAAACLFPFVHRADGQSSPAIVAFTSLYEQKILDYVRGLRFAESAYAYPSMGSTICAHAHHYAAVRGFPPRNAAEDFYLLNKLRKTGSIVCLQGAAVELRARRSARAPFGTGASVGELVDTADPDARIFYHPLLYCCLRELLQWQQSLALQSPGGADGSHGAPALESWQCELKTWLRSGPLSEAQGLQLLRSAKIPDASKLYEAMCSALQAQGFDAALAHCARHGTTPKQYRRHMQDWFDAFRTLRFLHEVRLRLPGLANVSRAGSGELWEQLGAAFKKGNEVQQKRRPAFALAGTNW